jgi:hypothetical protein
MEELLKRIQTGISPPDLLSWPGAHARQPPRRPVGCDAMQLAMRWLAVAIVFAGPGGSGFGGRLLRRRRLALHFSGERRK